MGIHDAGLALLEPGLLVVPCTAAALGQSIWGADSRSLTMEGLVQCDGTGSRDSMWAFAMLALRFLNQACLLSCRQAVFQRAGRRPLRRLRLPGEACEPLQSWP